MQLLINQHVMNFILHELLFHFFIFERDVILSPRLLIKKLQTNRTHLVLETVMLDCILSLCRIGREIDHL